MTKLSDILAPDPTWSYNESKDYLVTIGGVNFKLSEYAGACGNDVRTKVILKSGKELIVAKDFEGFVAYLHSQIEKFT